MGLHHYVDGADYRNDREDQKENQIHSLEPSDQKTGHQQIQEGHGEQKLPGKAHQLIVAEARQRAPNPHKRKQDRARLGAAPKRRRALGKPFRTPPACTCPSCALDARHDTRPLGQLPGISRSESGWSLWPPARALPNPPETEAWPTN